MNVNHEGDAPTQILGLVARDEKQSANELLPIIYVELRRLAARSLRSLPPGQTLSPTALVHEAYLRLVGEDRGDGLHWQGRIHFYAAAAEAMRRIILDRARAKGRLKRGGGRFRTGFNLALDAVMTEMVSPDDLIDLDEAISRLAEADPNAAWLVKLRVFAGLTLGEAAQLIGVARRTADRDWAFARAWLVDALRETDGVGD